MRNNPFVAIERIAWIVTVLVALIAAEDGFRIFLQRCRQELVARQEQDDEVGAALELRPILLRG